MSHCCPWACFFFSQSCLALYSPRLRKMELVYMRLVHLFVYFTRVNFCPFFSSSWCQGLAAACDCGTPLSVLITFSFLSAKCCQLSTEMYLIVCTDFAQIDASCFHCNLDPSTVFTLLAACFSLVFSLYMLKYIPISWKTSRNCYPVLNHCSCRDTHHSTFQLWIV